MKIGDVYFYKNGNVNQYDLTLDSQSVKEQLDKCEIDNRVVSNEEKQLLNGKIYFNDDTEKIYKKYIDAGYSVIRYTDILNFDDKNNFKISLTGRHNVNAVIGKSIDKTTADMMYEKYLELEQKDHTIGEVRNYHIGELGEEYEYYEQYTSKPSDVLKAFLKDKTGRLSAAEKEMFKNYRTFDLERLLIEDKDGGVVSNGNAGMILITKDKTHKRTNTKMQHIYELQALYDKIRPGFDITNLSIPEILNETGDVFVYIINERLLIWTDTDINSYQVTELKKLSEEVNIINQKIDYEIELKDTLNPEDNTIEDFITTLDSYIVEQNKSL